jgi:geranylgeranyl pyrophosphate synthase
MLDAVGAAEAYAQVRTVLESAAIPGSPLASAMERWLLQHPLPPGGLVPVAAACGRPGSATLGAACLLLLLTTRWLDDLFDDDREGQLHDELGPGHAALLSAAALTHAWALLARERALPREILIAFGEVTAVLAVGEHADVTEMNTGRRRWQQVAWRKTGVSWRFAMWAGAVLTCDPRWIAAAPAVGSHLGLHLQAEDDLAGAFGAGRPDLHAGARQTLPIALLVDEGLTPSAEVDVLVKQLVDYDIESATREVSNAHAAEAGRALRACPGPWLDSCDGMLRAITGGGEWPAS